MSAVRAIRRRSLTIPARPSLAQIQSPAFKMSTFLTSKNDPLSINSTPNGILFQAKKEKMIKFAKLDDISSNQFNSSLQNKISKVKSTQSIKSSICPIQKDSVEMISYTIKLLSNWGRSDLIACYKIIPVDFNDHHVPVLKVTATPKKIAQTNLHKLTKGFENKEDSNIIWSAPWPSEIPIEITIYVSNESPLKVINFFNATENYKDAGIRNVEVWSDDMLLWEGELLYDFPCSAHLKIPTTNSYSSDGRIFSKQDNRLSTKYQLNCSQDSYGFIPQLSTKTITIEFHSNYSNSTTFGLSGIEIISTKKEPIKFEKISEINIYNLNTKMNPKTLFRGHYYDPKIDDMFVFDRLSMKKNPSIEITLKEPIFVGQIHFWNYIPFCTGSESPSTPSEIKAKRGICTKNISIKLDNNLFVFIGKICQGDGTIKKVESSLKIIQLNEMDHECNNSSNC